MINFLNFDIKKQIEQLQNNTQLLSNRPFFTNSTYNNTGKIELELTTGTYLFWIVSSGGGQTPSLVLANLENAAAQFLTQGGMHNETTWSNGTLTITMKNNYFIYGYIKLR